MQTGIEKIKDWYDRQGQFVWWLYNGNQKTEEQKPRDRYPVDGTAEITAEESRARLVDVLESLEPGVYTIVTQKSLAATNSKTSDCFKIVKANETNVSTGISGTADFFERLKEERAAALEQAKEDFARQLEIHDLQRDNKELQAKLEELRRDNKSLEEKASDIEERKVSYIGQAVSAFSNIIAPNLVHAPSANIGSVEGSENNSDAERLQRVVGVFRAKEPEQWLDLLEGVAYIVQNEPATYQMVRPMLLRQ